jgi:hypothetical protein
LGAFLNLHIGQGRPAVRPGRCRNGTASA